MKTTNQDEFEILCNARNEGSACTLIRICQEGMGVRLKQLLLANLGNSSNSINNERIRFVTVWVKWEFINL